MAVKHVEDDDEFRAEFGQVGGKLVVMDFFATWCGPCRVIAPHFEQLAAQYPQAVFLKIDVQKCDQAAHTYRIQAMPTFVFVRGGRELERIRGANSAALDAAVKKYTEGGDGGESSAGGGGKTTGALEWSETIDKSKSECLNQSDEHPYENIFDDAERFLESDADEQLILNLAFLQPMRLSAFQLWAPPQQGPKTVKLFINCPGTLDFDKASAMEAVQEITLEPKHLQGEAVELKFVKFQNVQTLHIFVKDNQNKTETTKIRRLVLHGNSIHATNMKDFKRTAGKEGEAE